MFFGKMVIMMTLIETEMTLMKTGSITTPLLQ
jgi:hypothetical protein